MTSFRQIEANRRNAGKSTGPITEEGKHRSLLQRGPPRPDRRDSDRYARGCGRLPGVRSDDYANKPWVTKFAGEDNIDAPYLKTPMVGGSEDGGHSVQRISGARGVKAVKAGSKPAKPSLGRRRPRCAIDLY